MVVIKKEILRLEVPMDNVELVHVLNAGKNLLVELAGFVFLQLRVLHDVVEKFATTRVFHNEIKLLWRFYNFIKLNDVRMADHFQDVDLSGDSFDVRYICNPFLFKNLDRNFLPGQSVGAKLDLSEGALANRFLDEVISYNSPLDIDFLFGPLLFSTGLRRLYIFLYSIITRHHLLVDELLVFEVKDER